MEKSTEVLIGMVMFGLTALAVFAAQRWRQRRRVRRVEGWIKEYLSVRYGELPGHLNINGSDDPLWPVVVAFDSPATGIRQSFQFACVGPQSTLSLLSHKAETACRR
jgi:hypothetical protein